MPNPIRDAQTVRRYKFSYGVKIGKFQTSKGNKNERKEKKR